MEAERKQKEIWDRQVRQIFDNRASDNFKRRVKSPDRPTTLMDL